MSEVVLAFLVLDGKMRQTCVGCTQVLEMRGMVTRIKEEPLAQQGGKLMVWYQIRFPFTLDFCQAEIAGRHVGPAWGE